MEKGAGRPAPSLEFEFLAAAFSSEQSARSDHPGSSRKETAELCTRERKSARGGRGSFTGSCDI